MDTADGLYKLLEPVRHSQQLKLFIAEIRWQGEFTEVVHAPPIAEARVMISSPTIASGRRTTQGRAYQLCLCVRGILMHNYAYPRIFVRYLPVIFETHYVLCLPLQFQFGEVFIHQASTVWEPSPTPPPTADSGPSALPMPVNTTQSHVTSHTYLRVTSPSRSRPLPPPSLPPLLPLFPPSPPSSLLPLLLRGIWGAVDYGTAAGIGFGITTSVALSGISMFALWVFWPGGCIEGSSVWLCEGAVNQPSLVPRPTPFSVAQRTRRSWYLSSRVWCQG